MWGKVLGSVSASLDVTGLMWLLLVPFAMVGVVPAGPPTRLPHTAREGQPHTSAVSHNMCPTLEVQVLTAQSTRERWHQGCSPLHTIPVTAMLSIRKLKDLGASVWKAQKKLTGTLALAVLATQIFKMQYFALPYFRVFQVRSHLHFH